MKVAELTPKNGLIEWVVHAQGWRFMRVEGNEKQVIISKTGQNIDFFWTGHSCMELISSSKTIYNPVREAAHIMEIISEHHIEIAEGFPDKQGMQRKARAPYSQNPVWMYGSDDGTAVCRALVAGTLGEEINDEMMEA